MIVNDIEILEVVEKKGYVSRKEMDVQQSPRNSA
jgi:hypothetical protein